MAVFKLNVDAETLTPLLEADLASTPVRTAARLVAKTSFVPGFGVVTLEANGSALTTNNPTVTSLTVTSSQRGVLLEISGVSLSSQTLLSDDIFLAKRALSGGDTVITGPGDETDLMTFAGDDRVVTRGGDDGVDAGLGDDTVLGGGGEDTIFGGLGGDLLNGGAGNDAVFGGGGADRMIGGGGADRMVGGGAADDLRGGDGNDTLIGGAGNDRISGGGQNDRILGGGGADRLNGDGGADTLIGGGGADSLTGGAGNGFDFLAGGGGADTLAGGGGRDTLQGGGRNDVISGGGGDDLLSGGGGADRFVFISRGGVDVIRDFSEAERDVIDLSAVREIVSLRDLRQNHFTQDGDDAVITLAGGASIRIEDTRRADLEADDFIF